MSAEGSVWAQRVFGAAGAHILNTVTSVLCETHDKCAAANEEMETGTAHGYGLIYLSLPKALVKAYAEPPARPFRPGHANYLLPLVADVPLIPWRYAKNGKTAIDEVAYGNPVSPARRAAFAGDDQLTLDGEHGEDIDIPMQVREELQKTEKERFEALLGMIREADRGTAAVLAYASNPDRLFNAHLGYASLDADGKIDWKFREQLVLPNRYSPEATSPSSGSTSFFDSGAAPRPSLRPRQRGHETL